jgi:hypothetical protein
MIPWLNETEGKTRSEWCSRVQLAIERGALVQGMWQDDENACILAVMSGDVDSAEAPCLDAIGPLWLREFIYMAHDSRGDGHDFARELVATMALYPDDVEIPERVEHRMRSEVILPEALKWFDHEKWPDCAAVIKDRIYWHHRWLAGENPPEAELREIESRASRAAAAAGSASRAAAAAVAAWAADAAGASRAAWAAEAAARAAWAESWRSMSDALLVILREEAEFAAIIGLCLTCAVQAPAWLCTIEGCSI